jgi:methylmalonyl-CoA/ethylmalonyl-CoA epimerase
MTIQTNSIQKVGQIAVPVQDLKRSIHFYKDILGLQLLFSTDHMAFLDCDGLRIMLSLPEKEEFAGASSVIYFQVGDITESYKELKKKEVTFLDDPHIVAKMESTETWMVFFKDTEGNTHALMSEVVTS